MPSALSRRSTLRPILISMCSCCSQPSVSGSASRSLRPRGPSQRRRSRPPVSAGPSRSSRPGTRSRSGRCSSSLRSGPSLSESAIAVRGSCLRLRRSRASLWPLPPSLGSLPARQPRLSPGRAGRCSATSALRTPLHSYGMPTTTGSTSRPRRRRCSASRHHDGRSTGARRRSTRSREIAGSSLRSRPGRPGC